MVLVHLVLGISNTGEKLVNVINGGGELRFCSFCYVWLHLSRTLQGFLDGLSYRYFQKIPFCYVSYLHTLHSSCIHSYGIPFFAFQTSRPYQYPRHYGSGTTNPHIN
jgi:hypothetical protein